MIQNEYAHILARRRSRVTSAGHTVNNEELHGSLKPFQREIVKWAVRGQRRAIWADTGLGKTRMELEWARLSGQTSLIVAPLAVCAQTIREAQKIDIKCTYVRNCQEITGPGVWITNYERIQDIEPGLLDAVCLDESSILKNSTGKMRQLLCSHFANVPARLACTATPGPNDPEELTNHSEFLGHMTRKNMLATYFKNDGKTHFFVKGHAKKPMAQWLNKWAVALRYPSDLGDENTGYELPDPLIISEIVDADIKPAEGELFAASIGGVQGRSKVRRETIDSRINRCVELVQAEPNEPWIIWCGLNEESEKITKAIPGAVNIHGGLSPEEKAEKLLGFSDGKIKILVTKPQIASFGMNWQHCARMIFCGLGDSYEQYYQCIRRCHRFGQNRQVKVHVVVSRLETEIVTNVKRKQKQSNEIIDLMIQQRLLKAA